MSKGLLNFNIDLSGVVEEFSLSKSQVDQMCSAVSRGITMEIYRNWVNAAKSELNSTRNGYIRGLLLREITPTSNSIVLVGALNNMIENGCGPFDMKPGFRESTKVKYTKNGGWYLTIPFRFATPGAVGENEAFDAVMPIEIYKIAKQLTPQITEADGSVTQRGQGLNYNSIPAIYAIPKTRQSVINNETKQVWDAYTHKTSIYAGMIKNQKTYENATQSTYNTFRRVGSKSDPNSWIHKGIKQYNLADKAIRDTDIQLITDNTVDAILAEFGFGD